MNAVLFRAHEVLDIAIEAENRGVAFYGACYRNAADRLAASLFEYLVGQERQHAEIFARMRAGVSRDIAPPESYPGELHHYMQEMVRGEIFHEGGASLDCQPDSDPEAVFQLAVTLEERSILFYGAMKPMVRPSEAKTVERIISEEYGHIRRLRALHDGYQREVLPWGRS